MESCPTKFLTDTDGNISTDLNPKHVLWLKKDQFVMSWLMPLLLTRCYPPYMVCNLQGRYVYLYPIGMPPNLALEFFTPSDNCRICTKVANLAPSIFTTPNFGLINLVAVGKPVEEDGLISVVIGSLNTTYTAFVTTCLFALHDSTMSFEDFQSKLLSHEMLLEQQNLLHLPFAMMACKSPSHGPRKSKLQFTPRPHNSSSSQPHFSPCPHQ